MMRHSSSDRPPCLLSTSSGTRDFPTSWNSAAMPRSYSCSLLKPSLRPRATEKMQTFTERSEEHTSELQSQSNLVCRLLLEKKKRIFIPGKLNDCARIDT